MRITDKEVIVDFLKGVGPDHRGRLFSDTLAWTDFELEDCHDQVQWIFPLHEDSNMAKVWPVLLPETVEEAKKHPEVLANLREAKDRFEIFLGIGEHEDRMKQDRWCRDKNHNLLRITRIIRSLRLFGLEAEATKFYGEVVKVAYSYDTSGKSEVSDLTLKYWHKSYNDDIWESLR